MGPPGPARLQWVLWQNVRNDAASIPEALFFTTVAEVSDIEHMKEMLDTRKDHEEITRQIRALVEQQCSKNVDPLDGVLRISVSTALTRMPHADIG